MYLFECAVSYDLDDGLLLEYTFLEKTSYTKASAAQMCGLQLRKIWNF